MRGTPRAHSVFTITGTYWHNMPKLTREINLFLWAVAVNTNTSSVKAHREVSVK